MRFGSFSALLRCAVAASATTVPAGAQEPASRPPNHIVVEATRAAELLRDRMLASDHAFDVLAAFTMEIGPRLAGSAAEQNARDWIVARLRLLQVDSVWTQQFPVPRWERGVDRAEIMSPYPQRLVVSAFGFSVPTPEEGVSGEVALFPSLAAVTAATAEQVRGKIVFVDRRMSETSPTHGPSGSTTCPTPPSPGPT